MNPLSFGKVLTLLLLGSAVVATTGCQMVEAKAGRAGLAVMAGEARGGTEESADRVSGRAKSVQPVTSAEAVDAHFVQALAAAMRHSLELGQLGAQQATDEKLKRLAEQTTKATRQVYRDLETIAQEAGIPLTRSGVPRHSPSLARMRNLEGKQFDLAWAEEMLKREAATLFQARATRPKLKHKQVQQLAMLVTPVLKYNYQKVLNAAEAAGVPNERIEAVSEQAKLAVQLPGASESTSR